MPPEAYADLLAKARAVASATMAQRDSLFASQSTGPIHGPGQESRSVAAGATDIASTMAPTTQVHTAPIVLHRDDPRPADALSMNVTRTVPEPATVTSQDDLFDGYYSDFDDDVEDLLGSAMWLARARLIQECEDGTYRRSQSVLQTW